MAKQAINHSVPRALPIHLAALMVVGGVGVGASPSERPDAVEPGASVAAELGALMPAAPVGEWWDPSYRFRQEVTVTTSTSAVPVDYSVSVTIDHAALVLAGKSLASGDDIRVAYWNGGGWVELDRFLDPESAWDNAATKFWFKLQAGIGASSTDDNYYVYYDNSGAGAPPANANNALIFFDGFESMDLTGWDGSNAQTGDVISASTDQAYSGTWSGKGEVDAVADAQAMVWQNIAGQTEIYFRIKIFLASGFFTSDRVTVMEYLWDWNNVLSVTIDQDSTMYMWNAVAGEAYGFGSGLKITPGTWHTLEMWAVIDPVVGEAKMWYDGALDISATGRNLGSNAINRVATTFYWANPRTEPNIVYIDMPPEIRDTYQYFTQAEMTRLRAAGYDAPFLSLEEGVAGYVEGYLGRPDRYR